MRRVGVCVRNDASAGNCSTRGNGGRILAPQTTNVSTPPRSDNPISQALLAWGATVDRPMPWRGERDPYRIWLSEVILQQTRVAQGTAYYLRFLEAFPTVRHLAKASEDEVLALWQGLGYYSRARNLHKAAKQVAEAGGQFPKDYKGLLALPGVGPYSAAAIASFAYGEPVAVLDGNVYRVLARYFGINSPINKPAGQREFRQLVDSLLPHDRPAAFNQAIMDFGAVVCTPKAPRCGTCPLADGCLALAEGRVGELPMKEGKTKRRDRYFDYVHLVRGDGAAVFQRRGPKDIWQGLYDFPLVEGATGFAERPQVEDALAQLSLKRATLARVSQPTKHVLSHQDIYARFWRYETGDGAGVELAEHWFWRKPDELEQLGLPRLVERYLDDAEPTLF